MVHPVITEGPAIGCAGRGRTCSFTGRPFFIFHYKDYCIMAYPIWKDYNVLLGTGEYFDYTISVDGAQVYAGRAYSKTGQSDPVYIKVNDIIADYFTRAVPNWYDPDPAAILDIAAVVKVGETTKASLIFAPDWSYNDNYLRSRDGLSFPIDGWICNGQQLLYSDAGTPATPNMRVTFMGERGDFAPWLSPEHGDFGNDFFISGWWEDVTLYNYGRTDARVFAIDLRDYTDIYKVEIGTLADSVFTPLRSWKIWRGCCRYVLHYINAYGGWDSLLIRGNGKQTDTLKRYTRKVPYNNGSAFYGGTENYVNEIGAKYELHPGIMTEAQAARMFHLLNSCCVYLEDMQEGAIRPIVLTNATSEYKTWANQGHKLIEYTIEAELAQDRLRR
jgi:hypothetical protein